MIALEHQTVAVDVDLALAVDQSRRWCAKPGNDLLTTQNVVAVALCWLTRLSLRCGHSREACQSQRNGNPKTCQAKFEPVSHFVFLGGKVVWPSVTSRH